MVAGLRRGPSAGSGGGAGAGPGRRHSPAAPWPRGPASVPAAGGRRLPGGAAVSSSRRAPPRWCRPVPRAPAASGDDGRGRGSPRPEAPSEAPRPAVSSASDPAAPQWKPCRCWWRGQADSVSELHGNTNEGRVRLGGRRGPAARARRLQARPLASAFFCLVQGPSTMTVSEIRPACSP